MTQELFHIFIVSINTLYNAYPYQNKEEVVNTPLAKWYRLAQVNHRQLVELRLQTMGKVPVHALSKHVTFFVVNGQGTLKVDEASLKAQ